ncbi:MAG: DUF1345 domain-containing protein [Chthoniobacterales bacterium]
MDSHHRQIVAIIFAFLAAVFFLRSGKFTISHFIGIWDIYALIYLFMAWIAIFTANPREAHRHAKLQDSGRVIIFVFVVAGACASLFAVILVWQEHHRLHKMVDGTHFALSIFAVFASWVLVHTVFALHYAYLFYRTGLENNTKECGGLDFPNEKNPDYLDFAYFSFVVGMTCQVSDVQVTSRTMRRMTLLHGLLSFAFNTIILAVSINILAGIFVS